MTSICFQKLVVQRHQIKHNIRDLLRCLVSPTLVFIRLFIIRNIFISLDTHFTIQMLLEKNLIITS
jgi:hypothetical protein